MNELHIKDANGFTGEIAFYSFEALIEFVLVNCIKTGEWSNAEWVRCLFNTMKENHWRFKLDDLINDLQTYSVDNHQLTLKTDQFHMEINLPNETINGWYTYRTADQFGTKWIYK